MKLLFKACSTRETGHRSHKTFSQQITSSHRALTYAPVKENPHPGTCGALVGLYHHIGSSLSPQYVGDSRALSLFS